MTELATEDQMIALRILPRELAAEAVESLDLPGKKVWLLKAMGQEERAALLNNVAPDDRILLPGELPASMIRQLLTRLSQEERAVAVILLGYPERSIGRLMTQDYLLRWNRLGQFSIG